MLAHCIQCVDKKKVTPDHHPYSDYKSEAILSKVRSNYKHRNSEYCTENTEPTKTEISKESGLISRQALLASHPQSNHVQNVEQEKKNITLSSLDPQAENNIKLSSILKIIDNTPSVFTSSTPRILKNN